MSIYEIAMELMSTGFVGRLIVCAPLMLGCVAGYVGCGRMAKADEAADRKSRNTRYN